MSNGDFRAQMMAAEAQVLKALEAAKIDLAGEAFGVIVERSPVLTGAYRSEHVVTDIAGTEMFYESDNRAGPDTVVPYRGAVEFDPPSARAARSSLRGTGLRSVMIQNNRFYAGQLEHGTSMQAPQGIYQVSADEVANFPVGGDELRIV